MNEATARNIRVQNRYDELMTIGRHGHYETMFQVVREETESLRQQLSSRDAEVAELQAKVIRLLSICQRVVHHGIGASDVSAMREELATTADLKGLRVCHAEPVGSMTIFEKHEKLYRAWKPKP